MIRLTIPSIEDEDLKAVQEVLASGHLVQGPQVAAFEAQVAERAGTDFAVAVSNCRCSPWTSERETWSSSQPTLGWLRRT